jgi:hypothetical protein
VQSALKARDAELAAGAAAADGLAARLAEATEALGRASTGLHAAHAELESQRASLGRQAGALQAAATKQTQASVGSARHAFCLSERSARRIAALCRPRVVRKKNYLSSSRPHQEQRNASHAVRTVSVAACGLVYQKIR